ncbi:MAG: hypothetical protein AB7F25_11550 [Deferribacterales bacterium]
MFIRVLFLVILCISSIACAPKIDLLQPNVNKIDVPTLNTEQVSELGDTLVQKALVYENDGFRLDNIATVGDGFFIQKLTIQPSDLIARYNQGEWTCYIAPKMERYDGLLGTFNVLGGLAINRINTNEFRFCQARVMLLSPKEIPKLAPIKVIDITKPNFNQEIIYNGRNATFLKFLYRESTSQVLRVPFSQDIQYDLNDGKIIGFKGARIEVIEASNTKIKYRVLSNFTEIK